MKYFTFKDELSKLKKSNTVSRQDLNNLNARESIDILNDGLLIPNPSDYQVMNS